VARNGPEDHLLRMPFSWNCVLSTQLDGPCEYGLRKRWSTSCHYHDFNEHCWTSVKGQGVKRSRGRSSQGVKGSGSRGQESRGQGVMGSRCQGVKRSTGLRKQGVKGNGIKGSGGQYARHKISILRISIRLFSSKQNCVFVRVQKGMHKAPTRQTGLSPQIKSNRCNWADMPRSSKFTNSPKIRF
jgi:hypothetical protein